MLDRVVFWFALIVLPLIPLAIGAWFVYATWPFVPVALGIALVGFSIMLAITIWNDD